LIRAWIAEGGRFEAKGVDFDKQIRPVLEANCSGCHNDAYLQKFVTPGQPDKSRLFTTVMAVAGTKNAMPPTGQRLPKAALELLRAWILDGGRILPKAAGNEAKLVAGIARKIAANSPEKSAAEMKPYKMTVPGTTAAYEMVPIPAGKLSIGSAKGRKDEQPVHEVEVEPFWMSKFEVTWDSYRIFQFWPGGGAEPLVDGVSHPTRPYVEMSFGMGIEGYPAISMTQHAANKYAQWLSAKTGHFYRLPTEAEWEYACRAGETESGALDELAWHQGNSNGKYENVGTRKPNKLGLHDMLGNVMEWTLDQYDAGFYARPEASGLNPWNKATQPYPHAVRGGSWNDGPERLTCGARVASEFAWKMQDPQLPKSIWYHTDAQWLGFRLVRPLKTPPVEQMLKYWNSGVEQDP
jgi:formylglycine-generating enzyme required for sulfatase activity